MFDNARVSGVPIFSWKRSKVKLTGRRKPTAGGEHWRVRHRLPLLGLIYSRCMSRCNWMDSRISCQHSALTSCCICVVFEWGYVLCMCVSGYVCLVWAEEAGRRASADWGEAQSKEMQVCRVKWTVLWTTSSGTQTFHHMYWLKLPPG